MTFDKEQPSEIGGDIEYVFRNGSFGENSFKMVDYLKQCAWKEAKG